MKNTLLIIKREYLIQVKKKSFILLTLLAPLMILGFGALIALMFKANETTTTVHVIDQSGIIASELKSSNSIKYVNVDASTKEQMQILLKEDNGIDGLLILPTLKDKNFVEFEKNTELLINKKIGFETKSEIEGDLKEILRKEKIEALGVDPEKLQDLEAPFTLKTLNIISDKEEDSSLAFGVKYGLSMVLMYAVLMFIIIYGVRVMRSVLEEKNNRVVEIILSSVKPFELMLGKIIGVTLVALTQFLVWITMSVLGAMLLSSGSALLSSNPALAAQSTGAMPQGSDVMGLFSEVSDVLLASNAPLIIATFIFFFLFGYIFYSAMYAAIGSAVDNETETQQFTLFAILPLMVGAYGSITVMNNPEGPLAFWLSMVPFTSPVVMVARIPFGVPIWQILVSLAVLILSAWAMVFIAGKIYKVGVLMYGNKASLQEIWKWIRS